MSIFKEESDRIPVERGILAAICGFFLHLDYQSNPEALDYFIKHFKEVFIIPEKIGEARYFLGPMNRSPLK